MESNDIEKEIKIKLESCPVQLKDIEKDVIEVLRKLLNLFYSVINTSAPGYDFEDNEKIKELFSDNKLQVITFLKDKGYQPKEFQILKVSDFDDHLIYLPTLMNNLYHYLNKYEFNKSRMNLYFYLFHLIYFLLLAIIESKELILNDEIFKFYFHHIVHFFKKDEKTPESHYFFYHGAFKQLKKKYNIKIDYVLNFKIKQLNFTIPYTIEDILQTFKNAKLSTENKNEKELDFFGKFSTFMAKVQQFSYEVKEIYNNMDQNNSEEFINLFKFIYEGIGNIENNLNGIQCPELTKYKSQIDKFKQLISERNMTSNEFNLMEENFLQYPEKYQKHKYDIFEYIEYAKFFNACDKDSDNDYTNTFKNIINSTKFKQLYLKAMNSTHIKNFAQDFNLEQQLKIFMKKYSQNIEKYILYVPLTRGIKAYVSNYLRIALNINSVEILGEFDENLKNDFLISYLLIQMLHESFHFLIRITNEGKNSNDVISPKREKIKETYGEIGVDLILYIFGTEYIPYISKKNCILICDPKSWENQKTNFKVFNTVYLSQYKLVNDNDKESNVDSGLKCNISSGYEYYDVHDFKICTDDVIRYCF